MSGAFSFLGLMPGPSVAWLDSFGHHVLRELTQREMSHPVIPAPAGFDAGEGVFVFRPGVRVAYTAIEVRRPSCKYRTAA
jgi:hypothetical protein